MTDISFLNFFGTYLDFENLKKWFRVNSDMYKEVLLAAKERCDLEADYSSKLSKINARLLKSFGQSLGSVSTLWSKTAHFMNEEAEAHKQLGIQIYEDVYKPLITTSEQFNKFKKPIENDIDKTIKAYQDKREDEFRIKKKAFIATKDSEKSYECVSEYKASHPSSVPGNDRDRAKIEKRAAQCRDISTKAEAEYFESSMVSEECRHKYEQTFISGVEQLQKLETERLNSMKTIIESYQKCITKIPIIYTDISNKLLKEISSINIRDDLFENAMHYTSKSPNIYKTEQLLLDFYAESKENSMDVSRRKENLMKRINVLYQVQTKNEKLREGALRMSSVYEDSSQFSDETSRKKANRELSKIQSLVNLLSANIYKIQVALNRFDNKPEPINPLISLGMKISVVADRNNLQQSVLESKPGSMLPVYEPGVMSLSKSASVEEDYGFDTDSDTEAPPVQPRVVSQVYHSSSSCSSRGRPMSGIIPSNYSTANRPLPLLPREARCQAHHNFVGRDGEELSFKIGDILNVRNKLSDVWWEGELNGVVGLIPVSYVEEI